MRSIDPATQASLLAAREARHSAAALYAQTESALRRAEEAKEAAIAARRSSARFFYLTLIVIAIGIVMRLCW